MNKTFNINLGGIVFHVDVNAYELLDKYLRNLRNYFRSEKGGEEIVNDIEFRISELFTERLNENKQVISMNDVEEMIAQLGNPEEITGYETNEKEMEGPKTKVFSFDTDKKLIGGLCAGIADYFGWNVWLIRVLMCLLTCYSLTTVFFYALAIIIGKWKGWSTFLKLALILLCLALIFICYCTVNFSYEIREPEIRVETITYEL